MINSELTDAILLPDEETLCALHQLHHFITVFTTPQLLSERLRLVFSLLTIYVFRDENLAEDERVGEALKNIWLLQDLVGRVPSRLENRMAGPYRYVGKSGKYIIFAPQ